MPTTVKSKLDDAIDAVKEALKTLPKELGEEQVKGMKALINDGDKTGIIYTRHGESYQSSAPGEAPASPTGEYAESIEKRENGDKVEVYSDEIGSYLEDGTATMQPRPHIEPAFKTVVEKADKALQQLAAKVGGLSL